MRIYNNKDVAFLTFRELEIGTPFYNGESSDKTLFMKTENVYRDRNGKQEVFINAIKILDGSFVLFGDYSRVEIAEVHIEDDRRKA